MSFLEAVQAETCRPYLCLLWWPLVAWPTAAWPHVSGWPAHGPRRPLISGSPRPVWALIRRAHLPWWRPLVWHPVHVWPLVRWPFHVSRWSHPWPAWPLVSWPAHMAWPLVTWPAHMAWSLVTWPTNMARPLVTRPAHMTWPWASWPTHMTWPALVAWPHHVARGSLVWPHVTWTHGSVHPRLRPLPKAHGRPEALLAHPRPLLLVHGVWATGTWRQVCRIGDGLERRKKVTL